MRFILNLFMDMSSTEPVTQPAPNAPKGRKPRPPKAPKDPNAQAEPKEPKAHKPRQPKDPNAPQPEPKARKPRPPKAPKDPNAQAEPKVRKPRPKKPDITHSGPIHYHETDEPIQAPFVAVYSETIEEDVPTKQRKPRSSGLDLSMASLRL